MDELIKDPGDGHHRSTSGRWLSITTRPSGGVDLLRTTGRDTHYMLAPCYAITRYDGRWTYHMKSAITMWPVHSKREQRTIEEVMEATLRGCIAYRDASRARRIWIHIRNFFGF